eukprot:Lankesteria_metandrocarpae@DN8834_c0_g1_i1.p1
MVDTRNVQHSNITDNGDGHCDTSDNTTILNAIQNMATDMNNKFLLLQNHIEILDTYCHATERTASPSRRRRPRCLPTADEITPLLNPIGTATPTFPATATPTFPITATPT